MNLSREREVVAGTVVVVVSSLFVLVARTKTAGGDRQKMNTKWGYNDGDAEDEVSYLLSWGTLCMCVCVSVCSCSGTPDTPAMTLVLWLLLLLLLILLQYFCILLTITYGIYIPWHRWYIQ